MLRFQSHVEAVKFDFEPLLMVSIKVFLRKYLVSSDKWKTFAQSYVESNFKQNISFFTIFNRNFSRHYENTFQPCDAQWHIVWSKIDFDVDTSIYFNIRSHWSQRNYSI